MTFQNKELAFLDIANGHNRHSTHRPTTKRVPGNNKPDHELLADIYKFTGRFIAYPSEHAHVAHALWIAHTHLMDAWDSTPRLAFLSPEPSSGKTRALEITELLVPNAVEAINVTPAYLFRKVGDDEGKPTILYDEIDTVFGPKAKENEEIRGLINAGHRRGAVAGRCVVHGKRVETEEISAYCAVALAGLGWLPDTILTRSVIVRMRRRAPGEKVTPFRRRVHAAEGDALRERLTAWAAGVLDAMTSARPEMPTGVEDRDADVWEPLLAIADGVAGDWPKRARDAAVALVGAARDAEPSLGLRLLADLKTVFDTSTLDALPTAVILTRLIELPESPWGDLGGKAITDRILAKRLRQYGIKSRGIRSGDRAGVRGYAREDLHDAWLRYLSPCRPAEAQQAQQALQTPENGGFSQENVAEAADCANNTPSERNNGPNGRSNVADDDRNTPSDGNGNSSMKTNAVADVADVALVRGNGGAAPDDDDFPAALRRCLHCGRGDGVQQWDLDGRSVWLHDRCQGAWADKQAS
jgi:Protein of unknown function (DUF3631)